MRLTKAQLIARLADVHRWMSKTIVAVPLGQEPRVRRWLGFIPIECVTHNGPFLPGEFGHIGNVRYRRYTRKTDR